MTVRLYMGGAHQVYPERIDDDQPGPFLEPALHLRSEHGVCDGRVGADDHDDVGLQDGVECLGTRRFAQGGFQSVSGRGVAHPGAGIHVVVAESGADHLLHQVGLLVGAAGRGDASDGVGAVFLAYLLQPVGREPDRFFPGHLAPRVADGFPDQRRGDAVLVGGVAEREPSLDAGMPVIGVAVLVGNHLDHFLALHLRAEGTANAAVGAGRDHGVFRLAHFDQRGFRQRRGGAGLHAGAAGHALGIEERLVLAGRDLGFESAAVDGESEGALDLIAGAHAARTDDALAGIECEVGVALVLLHIQVVLARISVANVPQTDGARHVLQFAVAVGRARQAVQRMIGNVELHDVAAHFRKPRVLRSHVHAVGHFGGARCRKAFGPLDFHQAQPAGAEGLEHVAGAEFWNVDAGQRGRADDHRALGNRHRLAVDGELHRRRGLAGRRAQVCRAPVRLVD